MATIIGVGVGVFVLLVLLILSIAACYLGGGSRYSNQISAGATGGFVVITILLLVAPRGESAKGTIEAEIAGYDSTITHRALMTVSMVLAVIVAGGGMVAFHLAPTVYAKPVDFQADIASLEKQRRL